MNRNDRSITRFTMIGHATFHGYEMVIPLFVVVWLDVFDVSAALLGTVVAAGYALVGVGAVPSGILADSYGSKRLVTVSLLGMAGGFALLSLSMSVPMIALALLVWGATASLYHPAALSLLTRATTNRGTALAYHGAAGNVGTALVPFLTAVALTFLEWQLVAALLTVPAILTVGLGLLVRFDEGVASKPEYDDERPARGDGSGTDRTEGNSDDDGSGSAHRGLSIGEFIGGTRTLFTGAFLVVFVITMFGGTYYRGVFTFLPDVLAQLSMFDPVEIAGTAFEPSQYLYAGLLMVGAFGQLAGGKLSDRLTPEYAIVGAFAAQVAITLLFVPAVGFGPGAFVLACAVLGFFVYFYAPIVQALVGTAAPNDAHGLSFGYVYLGTFGVGAAGASVAGVALTYGDVGFTFLVLAAVPAVALALAIGLAVRTRRTYGSR